MRIKKWIPVGLAVLSGACFVAAGVIYYVNHSGAFRSNASIEPSIEISVEPSVSVEETKEEVKEPIVSIEETKEEPLVTIDVTEDDPIPELPENPYKDYFLQNADMCSWLVIPDTIVDYPVMWTPGDECYYLYKDFNKQKSGNGCLLLDTDSSLDPMSTNLIIHGHNNKNAMFGNLSLYADETYAKEHNKLYLYTKDACLEFEVMVSFYSQVFYKTDECFKFYKFFNADTDIEFMDYYDNIVALSEYPALCEASFGDTLLTLSTCSDHVENGRFVLVAKETKTVEEYAPFEDSITDVSDN